MTSISPHGLRKDTRILLKGKQNIASSRVHAEVTRWMGLLGMTTVRMICWAVLVHTSSGCGSSALSSRALARPLAHVLPHPPSLPLSVPCPPFDSSFPFLSNEMLEDITLNGKSGLNHSRAAFVSGKPTGNNNPLNQVRLK
jgi:hypothetical protein